MKTRSFLIVAAGLGAGAIALAQTATGPSWSPDPGTRELRSQISELQAQITKLEQRLAKVESEQRTIVVPEPLKQTTNPLLFQNPGSGGAFQFNPPTGEQPRVWGEREINGWKYYVIPCGQ